MILRPSIYRFIAGISAVGLVMPLLDIAHGIG
jgi:hypothetical protein